jgi:serine/threonine protein kinase
MLTPGTRLGAYEIVSSLGAGGMGEVYRARDGRLNRDVAIKVVPAAVAGNPEALARFERESHAIAALSPRWWTLPVSPDGSRVVGREEDGSVRIYRTDGGPPEPIRGLEPADVVAEFTPDGRGLLIAHGEGLPWVVERLDLETGRRTPATTLRAHDPAGLRLSFFAISRDAKYYVHSYSRLLSDLFIVQGLN